MCDALHAYDKALAIRNTRELPGFQKLGDIRSEAVTWGKIADILYDRGKLDEALAIRNGRIIYHRCAPHNIGYRFFHFFDQQPVENTFAGVIGNKQNLSGFIQMVSECIAVCYGQAAFKDFIYFSFDIKVFACTKIHDIAGNRQADGGHQSVTGGFNPALQ